jgi:hypothetical protein
MNIGGAKEVMASHEHYARDGDLEGVLSNMADDIVLLAPMCRWLKVRWLSQPLNAPLEWTVGAGISVGMAPVAAACG